MFDNLKSDTDIQESGDSLGGNTIMDSGIYPMTVDIAYVGTSTGGAMSLNLVFKEGNQQLKQTLWMTSGTAKGCLNYYLDKNKNKQYLPGFNIANALCLLTVGKEISDLETEDKVINLYDFDAKKEVPTKVAMLTDLLGQNITLGVIKQTVDKNIKNAAGVYVPSGETRDENEIDKLFRAKDNMTVTEIKAKENTATFFQKWEDKWKDVVKNKAKGGTGNGVTAGAPKADTPAESLFG